MPYSNTNTDREIENVNGDLDIEGIANISGTHIENDFTIGFTSKHYKKNTDGSGWASSCYAANLYTLGDSTEQINNLVGSRNMAEHIGTGYSYFIMGSENRAYHNGAGDTGGIYATNVAARVIGDGAGDHGYVVGSNVDSLLDNPNATIQYLQGMHLSTTIGEGDVTDNVMGLIIDFDYTGSGTISGDFEYIRIQNDTIPTVGGTARAINSLSVLPSEFGGTIQAPNFISTGIQEFADNDAAIAGGLVVGTHYRTGDLLKIVH